MPSELPPCCGKNLVNEKYRASLNKALIDFHVLTVRNKETQLFVKNLTGIMPSIVPDPTFLYDFRKYIKKRMIKDKYIFVYTLGEEINGGNKKAIEQYEDALGTYLVKLSERDLSVKDSRILSVLLHCIGDFERISDHAVNIRDAAVEMNKKNLQFSDKAKQELLVFSNAIRDIIDRAVLAFETGDTGLAKEVEPLEQVVDGQCKRIGTNEN